MIGFLLQGVMNLAAASGEDNESLLSLQVLGEILMLAGWLNEKLNSSLE